jgi:hypothetical protein
MRLTFNQNSKVKIASEFQELLAKEKMLSGVVTEVNTERSEAYRCMMRLGLKAPFFLRCII